MLSRHLGLPGLVLLPFGIAILTMSCEGDNYDFRQVSKYTKLGERQKISRHKFELELRSSLYEAASFLHICWFPGHRAMLDKMNMKVHASWQGNPQIATLVGLNGRACLLASTRGHLTRRESRPRCEGVAGYIWIAAGHQLSCTGNEATCHVSSQLITGQGRIHQGPCAR